MLTKALVVLGTVAVLLASSFMASTASSYKISVKNSRCLSCNISALTDLTFTWRYLGACMVCGEFYGSEVEHCCMCHQDWFADCFAATGSTGQNLAVSP